VVVYTGSYSSETNAPAAGIAEKNKIPLVAGSFSSLSPHLQGYQYLFSPFVKTDVGVKLIFDLLDALPADKRPSKIAVWAEKTDWGTELNTMVPETAQARGYQVVVNDQYSAETLDFSSFILASKTAGAEVVISVPTPVAALTMVKQMKELDYAPGAEVFWRGAATSLWAANLGAIGDYALFISNWNWNFEYPGNADLVTIYRATEGKYPTVTVGNGYAIVQIIADAIKRAGSIDSGKIRDAIAATTDLMTVQGVIKNFAANGVADCPAAIMQWQGQKSKVVLHEAYKNAEFLYPMPKWNERQ
jgi:branched-chain amino acid transport system substrate-binding protein